MTSTADSSLKKFAEQLGFALMNEAQATLSSELRELHRAVLTAFADSGTAPTVAWINDRASLLGLDPALALHDLDQADLVHTADGVVTVAYPFSGVPTRHRVQFEDGPAVWAMCAVDALGMPAMTGRNVGIASTDPHSDEAIEISFRDGTWSWDPRSTVVLLAGTTGCCTAADAACRYVDFFAGPANARAHLEAHPELAGEIYDQASAVERGNVVFGPLLGR
ncbi:alkylmercury lyase [Kribbella aluminosa]|uniref:Alkylmercury lyase n=1 Tax=Kribbella aluminosa TaxID=416017 RepID=A0ABS4UWH2_9ACTN|nr:alkylmercury lyase family protein [Kribbella aluminosa]MBP2356007.1 alkylmercury lyase [Kribbella aluminosa]